MLGVPRFKLRRLWFPGLAWVTVFLAGWALGRNTGNVPSLGSIPLGHSRAAAARPFPASPTAPPLVEPAATGSRSVWSTFESPDYVVFIARLRAVGCPELTIRDLVLTDLGRNYAERLRGLKSGNLADGAGDASAIASLLAERDAVAWQLLGIDYEAELRAIWPEDSGIAAPDQFAHLDPVQRWQARQIAMEFLHAEQELQAQSVVLGERFEQAVSDLRLRRAERLQFAMQERTDSH